MQACTHSAPSTVEMFSAAQLDPIRDRMISHPVLTAIHDIPSLRKSWKRTCSPCGDFMSLLKGLQRELTRIDLLWMPRADAHAAQLINQIVPGEESDAGPAARRPADRALYLQAMREVGASTVQFENFLRILGNGCDLNMAFAKAEVAEFVREVTGHTLKMVLHASPVEVMACFLYGREDVIPRMFAQSAEELGTECRPDAYFRLT